MAFASDSFTGADDTDLGAHTPEVGGAWTQHGSYAAAMVLTGNRARGGNGACYYLTGAPAGPDYSVSADVVVISDNNSGAAGVALRINTAADTMYTASYSTNGDAWVLDRHSGGPVTQLGTFAQTLTPGQAYACTLTVVGTALTVAVDGVTVITASSGAITAAGRAGLISAGTNSAVAGVQVDNFAAVNISPYGRRTLHQSGTRKGSRGL